MLNVHFKIAANQRARSTLPLRRQRVQTFIWRTEPPTLTRTRCVFGNRTRLVLRLEWLTLWPDIAPLPQTSQIFPTIHTSFWCVNSHNAGILSPDFLFGNPFLKKKNKIREILGEFRSKYRRDGGICSNQGLMKPSKAVIFWGFLSFGWFSCILSAFLREFKHLSLQGGFRAWSAELIIT